VERKQLSPAKSTLATTMPQAGYGRFEDDLRNESLSDMPAALPITLDTSQSTSGQFFRDKRMKAYLLRPRSWQAKLFCLSFWVATVASVCVGCYFLVPLLLKEVIVPLQELIKEKLHPAAVAVVVVAGTALVPLVLLPAMPFIWLAAVSLGVWKGYMVVQLGTGLGMSLSYLLGKHILRRRIKGWVEKKDWAQALFVAVKEAGPFKVIVLMRLGPAPYAWLNYACSLSSDIRFLPYMTASVIGRSPHNLIDIYVGSGVNQAGEVAQGEKLDPWLIAFYIVGLVLAICLSLAGYMYAKRALEDLRARALAKEQVLSAFSFPELEEYDDLGSTQPQPHSRDEEQDSLLEMIENNYDHSPDSKHWNSSGRLSNPYPDCNVNHGGKVSQESLQQMGRLQEVEADRSGFNR